MSKSRAGGICLAAVFLLGGVVAFYGWSGGSGVDAAPSASEGAAPPVDGPAPNQPAPEPAPPPAPIPLEDVGRFRVGAELGLERAGFSGLPRLYVFAATTDPDWPSLRECLEAAEAAGALSAFTPILIDTLDPRDDSIESKLREGGARVVIRSLKGRFQGALSAGFTCGELLALLAAAPRMTTVPPRPSPLRVALQANPEVIDSVVARDGIERARRVVALFREFDGDTAAVRAAEARLGS